MKKVFLMSLVSMISASAFAGNIACKNPAEAAGQGYEIRASDRTAIILIKGQKVADLVLVSAQPSRGGDQQAVRRYMERAVNGYGLEIKSGGFAGLTFATVLHGGFAGYMPVAQLNQCK